MGEKRVLHRVLLRKPEEKRQLGSPRRNWKDNIKMELRDLVCWAMEWLELAQGRDR
jgi:hypothetical protein